MEARPAQCQAAFIGPAPGGSTLPKKPCLRSLRCLRGSISIAATEDEKNFTGTQIHQGVFTFQFSPRGQNLVDLCLDLTLVGDVSIKQGL